MTAYGKVYLVGAGPGDPGLLTLKGLRCLRNADLVLYDGLVNPLLLRHTKADAERTCRLMTAGGRRLPQEEINTRLIEAARNGKTVVRLKGGDPFIFGRGGEEAAALAAAGIPFEIVPGITAATASGAYAGISLTHRDFASQVVFVTGHEDPTKENSSVDYELLARFQGTIVFYMGLHRLSSIAFALIGNGKPAETPCSVISRATTPRQQAVDAPLVEIADRVHMAGLHAPSLLIVGECVRQREKISWFEHLPLFGKSIGITRPDQQAESAVSRCLQLGAEPVLLPTIEILPPENWAEVDSVLNRLSEFDWLVFTSVNGVESFLGRLWDTGSDARRLASTNIACIGPSTAERLRQFSLRADLIPDSYRAEALADALKPHVAGKRVLWARASRGRDVLPDVLTTVAAEFEQVVVYQNVDVSELPPEILQRIDGGNLDWIALSSPSIAHNISHLLSDTVKSQIGESTKLASISPVTTTAAVEAGLKIAAEATDYTWDGLFEAIIRAESV